MRKMYINFEAGHIKSFYNGGDINIENLRPICKVCNIKMGSTNWDEYLNQNNN